MDIEQGFCPRCGMPDCFRNHNGRHGWWLLAVVIFLWDFLASETMSAAFERNRRHPLLTIGWAALTAHLYGVLPHRIDPIVRFGQLLKRDRHG